MDSTQLIKIASSVDTMVASIRQKNLPFQEKTAMLKSIEARLVECYNDPSIKKAINKEIIHGFEVLYKEIISAYEGHIRDHESRKELVHSDVKMDLARYQRELALLSKEMP
jgi:hypothetical protein